MSKSEFVHEEPWWREWPLALAVLTLTMALLGKGWIASALNQPAFLVGLLVIICSVILVTAVAIVRHADVLAHRLGEPAGTDNLSPVSYRAGFHAGQCSWLRGRVVRMRQW
jgi:hypothetical protein